MPFHPELASIICRLQISLAQLTPMCRAYSIAAVRGVPSFETWIHVTARARAVIVAEQCSASLVKINMEISLCC